MAQGYALATTMVEPLTLTEAPDPVATTPGDSLVAEGALPGLVGAAQVQVAGSVARGGARGETDAARHPVERGVDAQGGVDRAAGRTIQGVVHCTNSFVCGELCGMRELG